MELFFAFILFCKNKNICLDYWGGKSVVPLNFGPQDGEAPGPGPQAKCVVGTKVLPYHGHGSRGAVNEKVGRLTHGPGVHWVGTALSMRKRRA
jgi:hypothetical protein